MQCAKFDQRLHELLDQRRFPNSDPRLRSHAERCEGCQQELDAYAALVDCIELMDPVEPPEDLTERVMNHWSPSIRPVRSWGVLGPLLGTAAAVAIVVLPIQLFTKAPVVTERSAPPSADYVETGDIPIEPALALERTDRSAPTAQFQDARPADSSVYDNLIVHWESLRERLADRGDRSVSVGEMVEGFKPLTVSMSGVIQALRQTLPFGPAPDLNQVDPQTWNHTTIGKSLHS